MAEAGKPTNVALTSTNSSTTRSAEQSQGQNVLLSLRGWVDWLVVAYELFDEWPDCWYRHAAAVNELLALQQWHAAAMAEQPAGSQLALWHDGLARVRDRAIRPLLQSCHATGHIDRTGEQRQQWLERRQRMEAAADEFWRDGAWAEENGAAD